MSNDIIIPFDESNKSTRLSSDGSGMYYDVYMDTLTPGRNYRMDFKIKDGSATVILRDIGLKFRVD